MPTDEKVLAFAREVAEGHICQFCGLCCMDVSCAPITREDIQRLVDGLSLSFEEVARLIHWSEGDALSIEVSTSTGACPALRHREGKYTCCVYEHRPQICRDFTCFVMDDAKDYADSSGKPSVGNVFCGKYDSVAAFSTAVGLALISYRSMLRWEIHGTFSRMKDPTLVQIDFGKAIREVAFAGLEFDNSFGEGAKK